MAASKRRLKAEMGFFSKAPPPEPEPRPKMSINPTAVATVLAVIAVPIYHLLIKKPAKDAGDPQQIQPLGQPQKVVEGRASQRAEVVHSPDPGSC